MYVANKNPRERNAKDLLVIKRRLENNDFLEKIKQEKLDESSTERLIFFCALNINYKYIEEENFIYKEGN